MKNFVVYHKADKMGYPVIDVNGLAVYTKKSISDAVGGRIWLIAGEGAPCRYVLRAVFTVKEVEKSDRPEFKHLLTGKDGRLLDPMPRLNSESWFPSFRKAQGNFAFGFSPIGDPTAVNGLESLL